MLIFKSNLVYFSLLKETVHILLCWLDVCFCDSLSFAGVTIQELAPGLETGQAAIRLGNSSQGCAEDQRVSVSLQQTCCRRSS